MTAHPVPSTRHSRGTSGVAHIDTPARIASDRVSENQYLDIIYEYQCHGISKVRDRYMIVEDMTYFFAIFGTSLKKLDRSTSFPVAPHVILCENK